jgi:hypothetical protein
MSAQSNTSPTAPQRTDSAGTRRIRYAVQSILLLLAISACSLFMIVVADRLPRRFDVTATREHQLSPRTLGLLRELNAPYEIVVAGNFAGADPLAAGRTQDVLDNFTRSSRHISSTVIDVSGSQGLSQLDALLNRLVARFKNELDRQQAGVTRAATNAGLSAQSLRALSDDLLSTAQTVGDKDVNAAKVRQFLSDSAAVCRVASQDVDQSVQRAQQQLSRTIGRTGVPSADEAAVTLRQPLAQVLEQLRQVAGGVESLATASESQVAPATRQRAVPVATAVVHLRDDLARTITELDELPRTPLPAVARTLERSSAAIVIGPPGATGAAGLGVSSVDIAAILPPAQASSARGSEQAANLDLRARTEELLSAAISSIARDDAPIVVIMHAAPVHLAPQFRPIAATVDRLRLRGVDVMEWATTQDAGPPALTAINPSGKRPVIYVTISTDASSQESAGRMLKLAAAVRERLDAGKSVLVSVAPSTSPAIGQKDPMVEFLEPLGVIADSGRPLLQQGLGSGGTRVVGADLVLTDPRSSHALSATIRGIATRLPWAIPLKINDADPGVSCFMSADNAGKTIWAESEWIDFRRVPVQDRGLVANPPANDTSRDDGVGPWCLGATVERTVSGARQRIAVVGSNGWFLDDIAQVQSIVDGRPVLATPGNIELLESCIYWLAGQDTMLGTSANAQTVAVIPNISASTMTIIRWSLIAGLPLLILLIGAAWRLIRG